MADVTLRSPAGALVARVDEPVGPPPVHGPLAAVVCHPHPLYGGTLENKVVHAAAKALAAEGLAVVRFNFRGAGGSEGRHDAGAGEREDVAVALDLAERLAAARAAERQGGGPAGGAAGAGGEADDPPLLVAGYSFGSWVALSTAVGDVRVAGRLAIAPPANHYDFAPVAADERPLVVLYARDDELVPAQAVQAFVATCARPPRTLATEAGGHMFHGQLDAVRAAARAALQAAKVPAGPPPR